MKTSQLVQAGQRIEQFDFARVDRIGRLAKALDKPGIRVHVR